MILAFDALLALGLVWCAWRALSVRDLTHAVVQFVVFGLLLALAWARLAAPDIALAEAAIGAGLTGALLLDSLRASNAGAAPSPSGADIAVPTSNLAGAVRLAVWAAAVVVGAALLLAIATLPPPLIDLRAQVAGALGASGVSHAVTAVLLNFRGYDTLLEVVVLLLALLGLLACRGEHDPVATAADAPAEPLARALSRRATPVLTLTAVYVLWAGTTQPGGAFQAAALLAATAVLLHITRIVPAWERLGFARRLGAAAGVLLFLGIAAALLAEGALLRYPPAYAGSLILLIESGLTVSLALILAALFLCQTETQ